MSFVPGKTTVLSKIIGLDILPTGAGIVTRVPNKIRLHHIKTNDLRVEFVDFTNVGWNVDQKFNLTFPTPTIAECDAVKIYIETKTQKLAGELSNVSNNPIYIG